MDGNFRTNGRSFELHSIPSPDCVRSFPGVEGVFLCKEALHLLPALKHELTRQPSLELVLLIHYHRKGSCLFLASILERGLMMMERVLAVLDIPWARSGRVCFGGS